MTILAIQNHAESAKNRLLQQSRGRPRMSGIIGGMANVVQQLEGIFYPVLNNRQLDKAVGAQLDGIGQLVGISRGGVSDDNYKLLLLGKIYANNSDSTTETLLSLVRAVFGAKSAQVVSPFSPGFAIAEAPALVGIEVGSPSIDPSLYPAAISVCKDSFAAVVRLSWLSVYNVANTFTLDGPVAGQGLDGQDTTFGMAQLIYSDQGT